MPVDKSTEEWRNGSGAGATTYILHDFLLDGENREKAFTAEEVAEWVYENHADFPPVTLCRAYAEGNEEPLVGHVASLLARMDEHGRVTSRTVEQEGVREKRCYTSGFHTDRPSDVVEALEDLETKVGRLESKLERMDGTPEGGSAQFDQDTEGANLNPDKLDMVSSHITALYHNSSAFTKRVKHLENQLDQYESESEARITSLHEEIEEIDDDTKYVERITGDHSNCIYNLRRRVGVLEQKLQLEIPEYLEDPEDLPFPEDVE
ncbi:hypothetical protein [Natronococcus wangiae]|uniref:hypothetical protein n=1 Tax=Natronococcus wangiae TaxID=3068275 RepID=UPI00273E47CF|nr:hypothetical protein [Natronococcus sp. AD5]